MEGCIALLDNFRGSKVNHCYSPQRRRSFPDHGVQLKNSASAFVIGAFEHPTRMAQGISLAQLHTEVVLGALADAGLTSRDIDGYFCASDAPFIGERSSW